MLQQSALDRVFHALADPTRRAIVERLTGGAMSMSDLAAPFSMSLSAVGQHVQVLETSGLVRSEKIGRVRTIELRPKTLGAAERWFSRHRARWERRLDRLGMLLAEPDEAPKTRRSS
jgi:DNA-binding transcriptional ArsR family regulator